MTHASPTRSLPAIAGALALSTLVFLAVGSAQDRAAARPLKVGSVNLSLVFRKYPLTRKLARELREWKNTNDADIAAKEAALTKVRDDLVASEGGAARNAHRSLVSTNTELSELKSKTHVQYAKRLLENDRTVYAKIREAVNAVLVDEGLDLVLQVLDADISAATTEAQAVNIRMRTVLAASNELDITDLVLERLELELDQEKDGK